MKRLFVILCCLSLLVAGAATAWANCRQVSIGNDSYSYSPGAGHSHDHGTDSSDEGSGRSHSGEIHCPILKDFVPNAVISAKPNRQSETFRSVLAEAAFFISHRAFYRLIHDPPVTAQSNSIPYHILLSVFRI